MHDTLGIAVIGFGFMGRTHAAGFERARLAGVPCELRAICAASSSGSDLEDALGRPLPFDPASVPLVTNVDAVLGRDDIHAVSICTYTDTHVELATRAMAAGKHVLVEKPVAIAARPIAGLIDAAARAGTLCAPALCMRYWPGWPWLRDRVQDRHYGEVRRARFERVSSIPSWSDFYRDTDRSGGALFDLHIHDADFVRWCFGSPSVVHSSGDRNDVRTRYVYDMDAEIEAVGTWSADPETKFRMAYEITFEQARVTFDAGRDPALMLDHGGTLERVTIPAESAYDAQARDFVEAILEARPMRASIRDALDVTRLLEAEMASLETRSPVSLEN